MKQTLLITSVFITSVFACGTLCAQSPFDFRARFGLPRVERFDIGNEIEITAAYGADRRVCTATIMPSASAVLMNGPMISRLIDILTRGDDANAYSTERVDQPGSPDEAVSVVIRTKQECLSATASQLQGQYGSPIYEEFAMEANLVVAVTHRADGQLEQVKFRRETEMADRSRTVVPSGVPRAINQKAVDALISEILPASVRDQKTKEFALSTGAQSCRTSEYPALFVTHNNFTDFLTEASVKWK